jgi:sugar O-acyltransferase (sialic acid O-acetyltransferase NeuD family)
MQKELLLIGGGGHCRSVIDVIEKEGSFQIKGIIDVPEKLNQQVLGYPIMGTEAELPILLKASSYCFITLGQMGSSDVRYRIYNELKALGAKLPSLISPLAYVSPHASIGEGTIIMHQACVNAGASIGANCIINSQALIEHDAKVGDHCHISTAAVINGNCRVEDHVFVGSRATLRQGAKVGSGCLLGMGSVVLKDITEPGIYVGVPARLIR